MVHFFMFALYLYVKLFFKAKQNYFTKVVV